jgi:hypothetical protein
MKSRLLVTIVVALASSGALRAQATFPPDTDNAALGYWFALAEVQELPGDDATQHLFGAVVTGQMAWDEAKLGPILNSNLVALRTMQRATKLPVCNWGFDYRHGAWMPVWFGMRVKLLSDLNQLQGKREMASGNSQTAVDTWLAGIHFAQDMSRSGTVIVALIAQWMILDNLQPLRDSALHGKLSEKQKAELSAAVKAMPEDGFDWAAAWGVEFAIGDLHLQELRATRGLPAAPGTPETDDQIRAWEEYMLAAQAALRHPPNEAKPQIDDLESRLRNLAEVERILVPSVRQSNDARLRIAKMHEELLQALASK